MEIHHPNSRGCAKAWESITQTQGAKPQCWSPSPQCFRAGDKIRGQHQQRAIDGQIGYITQPSGVPSTSQRGTTFFFFGVSHVFFYKG